ncbi:GNAT family N-acetyltransferase [Krasilnikovia sp. MM14-A1259]
MLTRCRDGYLLTDDPDRLDLPLVHRWLSTDAYWAMGRTYEQMTTAVAGSWALGIYAGEPGSRTARDASTPGSRTARDASTPGSRTARDASTPGSRTARDASTPGSRTAGDASGSAVPLADEGPGGQVAFARVVTDGAVFAYLCDVYVDPAHRGVGLGRWMVGAVRDDLLERGIRRFLLATRDAHGVYAPLGFTPVDAARWMECDLRHTDVLPR